MNRTAWKILGLCIASYLLGVTVALAGTWYVSGAATVAMGVVGWLVVEFAREVDP